MVRFLALVLVLFAPALQADEPARRAKAALALAATRSTSRAVAPVPRVPRPVSYSEGYDQAVKGGLPLVVYVGCDGPKIEGAATAKADTLPGHTTPTVVVSYPVGRGLRYDAELPATSSPAAVKRAADAAARKIDQPTGNKPAPKPLDWKM